MSVKLITIAALTLTSLAASPVAFAGTQSDIAACRVAATNSGIDLNDHSLRFVAQKGNRARTLIIKAIPMKKNADKSFKFTCSLNRNQVLAVNTHTLKRYVKK